MSLEIVIVLGLLAAAAVLFASERLPIDVTALVVMSLLLASGIVTPAEGLSGFSNPATVTIAAMFVLSAALTKTGVIDVAGVALTRLGRGHFLLSTFLLAGSVGLLSCFVNNTAAVAVFLPIALRIARDLRVSASKLLMPLSFASMFGGICTLIGTSTNVLVSSIAEEHGFRPLSMFELTPIGLIFFAAGMLYLLGIGIRIIPNRRPCDDLSESFRLDAYVTDLVVLGDSPLIGRRLTDTGLGHDAGLEVLEIRRGGDRLPLPGAHVLVRPGDVLRAIADVTKIRGIEREAGLKLQPHAKHGDRDLESAEVALVEAVVAPGSALVGKSLEEMRFRQTFGATVLALRHRERLLYEGLGRTPLSGGDALLIEVPRDRLEDLKRNRAFVLVTEHSAPELRPNKVIPALVIIVAVVTAAALGIAPVVVSAVIGVALLVLTRCITLDEAYAAVDWRIVVLLAGVLTLGTALETTGAASLLATQIANLLGTFGPTAMLSGLFLLTTLLTNVMSNAASAALLAPIAIATASTFGVSSRPFLIAVTLAASLSFMTPVGYQTNTLIYGPGRYRFIDFVRVGTPLNILFWILGSLLIPVFWPF